MIHHFKQRTGTEVVPTHSGKSLGRRQKFNEYYDGFERLYTAVQEGGSSKENRYDVMSFRPTQRELNRNHHPPKNVSNKHSKEFFKKMAANLRSENTELD